MFFISTLLASWILNFGRYGDNNSIILFLLLLSAGIFVYKYYDWVSNIWVVTNLRVVDEWGVFTRNSKESVLEKVNNVSYEQSIVGRMLNYGDVQIQTAAEKGDTINKYVTDPRMLKNKIIECQDQCNELALNGDMMDCPFCAEGIKAKAKICRFCDKEIPEVTEALS